MLPTSVEVSWALIVMETTKGRFLLRKPVSPVSLADLAEGRLLKLLEDVPRLHTSTVRSWAQKCVPCLVRESLLHRLNSKWEGVRDRKRTIQKVWSLLYSGSINIIDLPAWLGESQQISIKINKEIFFFKIWIKLKIFNRWTNTENDCLLFGLHLPENFHLSPYRWAISSNSV